MQGMWFDYLSALFAAISAFFWVLSARVRFPFGFDMDQELHAAAAKAGKLNATAAVLAALAAVLPAMKTFGVFMSWVR
jgi:hypothetical protein